MTENIKAMPEILLLTHGPWGAELCNSLRMVVGEISGVCALALMPVDTFSDFYQSVLKKVVKMPPGSLILTDFLGGTTSNVAARISHDHPVAVICGLNASLLLQALDLREQGSLADQVSALLDAGRASCCDVVAHIQNNTADTVNREK